MQTLPRLGSAGVRRSAKSLLHLFVVVAILTLSILTLSFLDNLQGHHQEEQSDTVIDNALLQRLRAYSPDAQKAAAALLKRGASFKDENELIDAIARETAVIASASQIRVLKAKLSRFDEQIPAATDDVLNASSGDKKRAAAISRLTHLTQSRAAIAQLLRARTAEIEAAARDHADSLRPVVRSALARRGSGGGILASLGRRLGDNTHPMHLAYDVGFYTALLAAVLALVYLVWTLVLRALPFGGVYERFDDKIGDWLKREPSRRGNVGRAVASVALAAIGAATVAEGIARQDTSPFNEASVINAPAMPPEEREPEPRDTRELAAELQKIEQNVLALNQTVEKSGTDVRDAVDQVKGGVGMLSDNMRPLADAAPQITSNVGRAADATARLDAIERHLGNVSSRSNEIAGFTSTSAGHLGTIDKTVAAMPEAIGTSVSNAADRVSGEVVTAEQKISKSINDRATQGNVRTAVHASHTSWRRLLWLEKYKATSAAIAALESAVDANDDEVTAAVRSLADGSPMYRTIFLDRIRNHIAGTNPANADALTRKYAPLILSLCRTAE